MPEIHPSFCRACPSCCPILVAVEDGIPVKVTGDPNAPLFESYTCPKGRALPELHTGPTRLLHSVKRESDGSFRRIASEQAMDEIAHKVQDIIGRHGPKSVALYIGTGGGVFFPMTAVSIGWMMAIGSPMIFTANTIDKPGSQIAQAAHGDWPAGHPSFESAEAWLLIGLNPIISKSGGFPPNNPAKRLKDAVTKRGMKLIVIDPRETESTARAFIHLQAKPGNDPAILAAMLNVIISRELYDEKFLAENTANFEFLKREVAPFLPELVAERAGISTDKLVEAAVVFAEARYAAAGCGTGPSFAMHGSLTEYLATCLMTVCGFWSREGDVVQKPNVLLPAVHPKAQPRAPFPDWGGQGVRLRVRGLRDSAAGLPTGALAEEILLGGEGQIRALFVLGGNPMMAWPDQIKAHEALKSLELLVTSDMEMSATARLSHYVIAPKLMLEIPGTTVFLELIKYQNHTRGIEGPYAQYTPKIVDPPKGSDLIEDWELYYGLAKRMGLQLKAPNVFGVGRHQTAPADIFPLDMERKPTGDEVLSLFHRTSRIPLDEVKKYPHGHVFEETRTTVAPREPSWTERLDVGNAYMMAELRQVLTENPLGKYAEEFPFLLVPRRTNRIMNSHGRNNPDLATQSYNPAFLHSADLARLGLSIGSRVMIRSPYGFVHAIVENDDSVRPGIVSITHGFGGNPGEDDDPAAMGCNVGRLTSSEAEFDPITGIPRMGALPVAISNVQPTERE
jgi:anaerobic selenocysteine-containing dehydrogenase